MPALVRAAHRQDKAGEEPLIHPHRDHSRDSHTEKLCDLYPVCSYRGHKGGGRRGTAGGRMGLGMVGVMGMMWGT